MPHRILEYRLFFQSGQRYYLDICNNVSFVDD